MVPMNAFFSGLGKTCLIKGKADFYAILLQNETSDTQGESLLKTMSEYGESVGTQHYLLFSLCLE